MTILSDIGAELHLWVMPVGGRSPRPALEGALRPFLDAHPGASVKIWVVPWGTVWDRLMSALKGHGGPAPDIFQVDGLWTGTLACLGLLRDLTPRLWEMEGEGFLPALWDSCSLAPARRLFAVPWTLELRALHARRDALSRAGLSPADLSDWDGIRALLAQAPGRAAAPPPWTGESLLADWAPWLWSAGGDFLSVDGLKPDFLSTQALQAAALHRDLLASGPAAGVWTAPLGGARDPSVVPLPPPRGPACRSAHAGGGALALSAATRHPEMGWQLLRHLTSAGVRGEFCRAMGLLPPRAAEADEALEGEARDVLRESLSAARAPSPSVLSGSFERLLQRHLAGPARRAAPWAAWRGALEAASRETERLLSAYEPAAI